MLVLLLTLVNYLCVINNFMAVSNKRNVRGKTRGINLDRLIEANGGSPLPITLKPSNEIGLTVRQHAPIIVETWKQMSQHEINAMFDRLKVKIL